MCQSSEAPVCNTVMPSLSRKIRRRKSEAVLCNAPIITLNLVGGDISNRHSKQVITVCKTRAFHSVRRETETPMQ